MLKIFSGGKAWSASAFSDLPEIRADAPATLQHFCIVAGGLALILSRLSPIEMRTKFRATEELYRCLKHQLRKMEKTNADAELISDVMHEVAEVADPHTRISLKTCLEARSTYEQQRRHAHSSHAAPDSAMTQSPTTTRANALTADHTRLDGELIEQRARSLRDTIHRARNSAEDASAR
jgi:hypothetical protein